MIKFTFKEFDKLRLKEFCERLERFALVENHFVEGGLVLSLNAPFGSGKSTFLEMWRNDLLERRESDPTLLYPITLNAWESDYCGDPLLALISALTKNLDKLKGEAAPQKKAISQIRSATEDILHFSIGMANGFVANATGLDPLEAGKHAQEARERKASKDNPNESFLESYEKRLSAMERLKAALAACVEGDHPRFIIFVDELDRCRPNYAIEYLETIKHVFDIKGLIFVLAVDRLQLQSSARALFGSGLDFEEYYRKFSHRTIQLPIPSDQARGQLSESYAQKYLTAQLGPEKRRYSFLDYRQNDDRPILEVLQAFALTPRQIDEYFRILGHATSQTEAGNGRLAWCFAAAMFWMVGLSLKKPSEYHRIGRRQMEPKELGTLILEIFRKENERDWWAVVIFNGISSQDRKFEYSYLAPTLSSLGFMKIHRTDSDISNKLNELLPGWGTHQSHHDGLARVYQLIEDVKTLGQ